MLCVLQAHHDAAAYWAHAEHVCALLPPPIASALVAAAYPEAGYGACVRLFGVRAGRVRAGLASALCTVLNMMFFFMRVCHLYYLSNLDTFHHAVGSGLLLLTNL
jgi:hypothetical protein